VLLRYPNAGRTRESSGAHGFGYHHEDHGYLVNYHLCGPQVVLFIEHVRTLEFSPLDLPEIKTPDDCHF
jgi:hypothetical protein